ncbi:MAG: hypothetical protein OXI34_06300 [Chloroflexota bacterium]|nr:hypothetical protein [Chloroflexota bacterium]MDE2945716.1 hypothetical protein [Chloroflexota bacterium]
MPKPLEKEYEFYLSIREVLAREHDGKFVAIKGKNVLGIFDDYRHAADAVYVEHEYGTVLMQPISKDPDADTIVVYTPHVVSVE